MIRMHSHEMPMKEIQVPNFDIYKNGSKLSLKEKACVEEIIVDEKKDIPASFMIKYNIVDFKKFAWDAIDLVEFQIGDTIRVDLGMDQPQKVISGEIDSMNVFFGEHSYMEISGFNLLYKLTFGRKTRKFENMTASDIVSSIASESGLSPQVDSTKTKHEIITQNNKSNYLFLLNLAKRIDYELMVNDKTLIFRKSRENDSPAVKFTFGVDIFDFSTQMVNLDQGSQVEVRGWDMNKKEAVTGSASSGDEDGKMGKSESGFSIASRQSPVQWQTAMPVDRQDAGNLAKERYNQYLMKFMTGSGQCSGNPDIRLGKTIDIQGLGKRYSGKYYIHATTHRLDEDGYYTDFSVRKTAI